MVLMSKATVDPIRNTLNNQRLLSANEPNHSHKGKQTITYLAILENVPVRVGSTYAMAAKRSSPGDFFFQKAEAISPTKAKPLARSSCQYAQSRQSWA